MEQIEEMCKPLLQYLKETCDPYTEICISVDGVKVKQTVLGLPGEKVAGEEGGHMSKTKLCENISAKRYNYVAGLLAGGIRQQCLSTEVVSKKTGIPERTVNDRLKHPENTRLEDLYKLCDVAGVKISFELKEVPE